MKRKNLEKYLKQTITMALMLALTVPMAMPAFDVEAQETEVLEDLQLEENSAEVVEDMEYVVYIDTTKEVDGTENENSVEEEISISQNAISENTVLNKTNKPDETEEIVEENFTQSNSEEIQAELKESIEKAELIKDEETIIYTADLTQGEIEELQESEASIVVEENIELFGAGKKKQMDAKTEVKEKKQDTKKEKKEETKKSTKETTKSEKSKTKEKKQNDSDKEKSKAFELKMEMKKSSVEAEETEPEWNVSMVNGDVAGEMEGETVKVAVMDSGIELLSGIPVQQISNLVATEQDLPYYMNDMTGHGTAIAGIINDIAPNAEIYSVRIMDAENKATLSRVVEGIYWCIENDIDIINMSFGTTVKSTVLEKAIKDASDAGILLVSSAGNGDTQGVEYPAAYEEVIAVGAVNTSAQKTEESAVGEEVELVAPGEQILSDSMLGLETVVSGTSMAAPHVTAVAAVLWQKDKTKSPAFIRSLLAQTANELGGTEEYGNGLIDLEYALAHYDEFAKKYQEPEKEISTQDETAIILEESITDIEPTNHSPIIEDEEQLVKENTKTVETYEDVEYVEGRWREEGHWGLLSLARKEWKSYDITFGDDEIKAFKRGAVYPDAVFKVADDKNDTKAYRAWHGGYSKNYVANYRFCTMMGKYAGNISKYKMVKGQSSDCYDNMAERVTDKWIVGSTTRTWEQIAKKYNLIYTGKNFRKYFIYGMASHIITDTFCHSAYVKKDGKYIKLKELKVDDDPTKYKNRYKDAQEAMSMVLLNCYYGDIGSEIDFSPRIEDWGKDRAYYLRNILKYTKKSAVDWTAKELEEAYKAINYEE